jgi:hypothetical protein
MRSPRIRRLLVLTGIMILTSVIAAGAAVAQPNRSQHFVAPLSGDQEATPVDTNARGLAQFHLNHAGDELRFKLIVANIENVLMAHIHLEASNGPVVVWLHTQDQAPELLPGRSSGIIAEGVITDDDLVNVLAGATLDDLLDEIRAGNAYVNVHTQQHPGGEIAGLIR